MDAHARLSVDDDEDFEDVPISEIFTRTDLDTNEASIRVVVCVSAEVRRLVVVLPAGSAWFAADTSDGACHYGELRTEGAVHAVCGAVFTPITNLLSGVIACWWRPVDADHGCPTCGAGGEVSQGLGELS